MTEVANKKEALALAARGAIFYVGHSGGKDSMAEYEAICKIIPHDQIRVIHADLGEVEHRDNKPLIRANIAHDLMIAKSYDIDGNPIDFFGMVRRRRAYLDSKGEHDAPAVPSGPNRYCTSDLKTGPIWREIKNDGKHEIVVNCVGIRGLESKSRAKKIKNRGTLNINKKATCNKRVKREAYDWWPIAHWTIDEVWAEITEAGKEPWAGYGFDGTRATKNERMSCVFCIFGSPNDLARGARERPELLEKYIQLEKDVRGTLFNGASLLERIETHYAGEKA